MGKLSRQRGVQAELQVARFWNTHRNHFEAEDIRHPVLSIESKSRVKAPAMLHRWMSQAKAAAPDGKTPIVQIHELGKDYADDLCVIRARDLRDLVGEA